jgi:23S rRNA pseudouridine2605 synthase
MKKTTRSSAPSYKPDSNATKGRKRPSATPVRIREDSEPAPVAELSALLTGPQRLHKVLALAGLGSRREMETLIESGRITVNGEPAQLGMSVGPDDVVRLDRRPVRLPKIDQMPRILLYHKLEGEIVSRDDPEHRASVFEKLPHLRGAKWVAVGRLDFNTCGLLIFTTSGELANHFMHPRYEVEREYAVRVLGELTEGQLHQLTEGIELDDGVANFDVIQDRGGEGANHWYQVILREGKKREVRRLFEALGMQVSRLMRVRFGPVNLPARLKRGQMLELPPKEVAAVLEWAGLAVPKTQQRQLSAREKEQVGKSFKPKVRALEDPLAKKPAARRPAGKTSATRASSARTAPAKPAAGGFDPATKQRRSDRNRNRGGGR